MYKTLIPLLFVVGCSTTATTEYITPPVYHPPLPYPYEVCDVSWEVIEVDNNAKVALSYNDNVKLAVCIGDMERYISQLVNVVCHYRQCIKEPND